jgi:hypothetical protein
MKYTLLLAFSLQIISFCFAQKTNPVSTASAQTTMASTPAPTSTEEYNFAIRGYRIQTEGGLDPKKGYHFNDLFEKQFGMYNFTAKTLIREQKNEAAGILVIVNSKVSQKDYYVCIPFDNPELFQRYWGDLSGWDKTLLLAYTEVVTLYLGAYAVIGKPLDLKK